MTEPAVVAGQVSREMRAAPHRPSVGVPALPIPPLRCDRRLVLAHRRNAVPRVQRM